MSSFCAPGRPPVSLPNPMAAIPWRTSISLCQTVGESRRLGHGLGPAPRSRRWVRGPVSPPTRPVVLARLEFGQRFAGQELSTPRGRVERREAMVRVHLQITEITRGSGYSRIKRIGERPGIREIQAAVFIDDGGDHFAGVHRGGKRRRWRCRSRNGPAGAAHLLR